MNGLNRGMEYIANRFNSAKDTKQSIITAANSYDYIKKRIKEIEEKTLKEIKNEKQIEKIHFDPNEIEPIVLKNKEDKIVSNDKFKEKLKIRQQKQLENEGKIVTIKSKEKDEREIG